MSTRRVNPVEVLRSRFVSAWQASGGADAAAVYGELTAQYGSGRYYHDFGHIAAMFAVGDELMPEVVADAEFALAIFFHDSIYEAGASDNEARSAAWVTELLGLSAGNRIARLVLATDTHISEVLDEQRLIDLDLCFLGVSKRVFAANVEKLVLEFGHLKREAFLAGQARYLTPFLARPHIYYTDVFRSKFELKARRNIESFVAAFGGSVA